MNIRFAIKNTATKAEKEGDVIIRYSGTSEPFSRVSERDSKIVGVDGGGNPKLTFTTGLDETKVQFFKWYNEEEKKTVTKSIKALKPVITDFYGGPDVVADTNSHFWQRDRNVNRLSLTPEDIDTFYDTKNPAHALLYLSVISGAFIDLVAPTRDWAERHQLPHYLVLETEEVDDDEDGIIRRSDAHAMLSELRREASTEALFILAWCIQYDTTNAFGAYLRSTPLKDLASYHASYIDGKIVTKRKRDTAKNFIEYAEKWKGQQTRPDLYLEAYVKAGEYFNFIEQRDKKYVTTDGTLLGNTVQEAVETLKKPKFQPDLEKLRDQVEAKWKE